MYLHFYLFRHKYDNYDIKHILLCDQLKEKHEHSLLLLFWGLKKPSIKVNENSSNTLKNIWFIDANPAFNFTFRVLVIMGLH